MFTITLICTRHREGGNCNSDELLRIITAINPDVIFEELSEEVYDRVYKQQIQFTLESNAVKKHLVYREITHIPIDTFELPKNHYSDIDYMHNKILGGISLKHGTLKQSSSSSFPIQIAMPSGS